MNPTFHNGLFLVTESTLPVLDSEALSNDIVARLERELALANPSRAHLTYLPDSFYHSRRETPFVVLRRVLKNIYPFSFNA